MLAEGVADAGPVAVVAGTAAAFGLTEAGAVAAGCAATLPHPAANAIAASDIALKPLVIFVVIFSL